MSAELAGDFGQFNFENRFINQMNALIQGNPSAAATFNFYAAPDAPGDADLIASVSALYDAITNIVGDQRDAAIAFLTRPEALAFYRGVAEERILEGSNPNNLTLDQAAAIVALGSIANIAVRDGVAGLGADVSALLNMLANDMSPLDPENATDISNISPVSFNLTTGVDNFTGGENDDVFNASLGVGIDGLIGVQTLQGADVLDGGAGFNTLNAELNGTGTTANPTISNIQVYNLTSFGGLLFGGGGLDLSRASDYEQLWNRNSRFDLDLVNVGEQAIIGMDGVRGGTTYTVEYDGDLTVADQVVVAQSVGTAASGSAELEIITSGAIDSLTLNASASRLVLDAFVNGTLTINVAGGNIIDLVDGADLADDLVIAGAGALTLSGSTDFANLVTLDATGYDENLTLDISGSGDLESVLTGGGDDVIRVGAANFSAETVATTIDLGEGDNRLVLEDTISTPTFTGGGVIDSAELSALDFTLAPVNNVQTLELVDVDLFGDANLSLEGVGGLETLVFSGFTNFAGSDLSITEAPEDLLITTAGEFEMNGGLLSVEGVVNLTVQTTGPEGFDLDVRIDGGLESTTLVSLVIDAADDADLFLEQNLDALTTVNVTAQGDDADVEISLAAEGELAALSSVNVTAATDADLTMTGRAGAAGQQQVQLLQLAPSAATTAASVITLTVPGVGNVVVNVPIGSTSADAAILIAAAIDGLDAYTATAAGDDVTVTSVAEEPTPAIAVASDNPELAFTSTAVIQPGIEPVAGTGFEALETVEVVGGEDADLDLEDIYGAFTATVSAGEDADVDLTNTGATALVVEAGGDAFVTIDGALFGNPDLVTVDVTAGVDATVFLEDTSGVVTMTVAAGGNFDYIRDLDGNIVLDIDGNATIDFIDVAFIDVSGAHDDMVSLTVSGASADVTLSGDLGSFATLDLTDVTTLVDVDASAANFGGAVQYLIGSTSNLEAVAVDIIAETTGVREFFRFVGDDIGDVVIDNFESGGLLSGTADRLDLSGFVSQASQLSFVDDGGDLVITAVDGQFSGSITIIGGTADATDIATFNIIYG